MKRLYLLIALMLAATACSSTQGSPAAPTSRAVTSVAIAGVSTLGAPGQTNQLTAVATLGNGITQDVTGSATWQSSDPAIGTVTGSGMVTAVAPGATTVTATYQGKTATLTIAISFSFSPANTLTATIDGAPLVATTVSVIRSPGRLAIGAATPLSGQPTTLFITMPEAIGSYAISSAQSVPPVSAFMTTLALPAPGPSPIIVVPSVWAAGPLGGSGTIIVSSLTSSSAAGTFSLSLAALPGSSASGTRTVANGSFSVVF